MQRVFLIGATAAAVALAVSPAAAERDATIDSVVFECEEGLSSITVVLDSETPAGLFACTAGATLWPQGGVALDETCSETVILDSCFKGAKLERVVLHDEDSSSTKSASEDTRGETAGVHPCVLNGNTGPCDASFFGDPPSEENSSEPSGPILLEEDVSPSWDEEAEVSLSLEEPVNPENSEHLWVALEKAEGEGVALQSQQEQWVAYRLSIPGKSLANKRLCYKCLSYETDTPSVCTVRIDVRVDAGGKSPPSEQSGAAFPEELPSADVAETDETAELPRALRAGVSPRALADAKPNARGAEKKGVASKRELTEEEPTQTSGKTAGARGENGIPRENATEKGRELPEKPAATVARGEDSSQEGKVPEEANALEKGDEVIEGKKRADGAAVSERIERKSEPIRATGRTSPPASSPALRTSAPSDTALASSGPPAALPPEKEESDVRRSEGKEVLKTEPATPAGQVKPTDGPPQPEKPLATTTASPQPEKPVPTTTASPQPEKPVPTTTASPQPEKPLATTTASPQPEKPVSTTTASPQPEKPVPTTTASPQPEKPLATTTASPQSEKPLATTTVPPQPEKPLATTTAPPQPEKPVATTTAPQQPEKPVATTTAPPQPEKPVATTTVPPPAMKPLATTTVPPQPEKALATTTAPPQPDKQAEPPAAGVPTGERGSEPRDAKGPKSSESEGRGSPHGSEKEGSSSSRSTRVGGAGPSPQNSSDGEGMPESDSGGETGQTGKVVCSSGQVQWVKTEAFKTVVFQCGSGLILDPPFSATTPQVFDYVYNACTQHVALTSVLPGARFLADEAEEDSRSTTYKLTLNAGPPQATTLCYKCIPPKSPSDHTVFTPGCALIVTVAADPNASAAVARATWTALTLFSAFVVAFSVSL